MRSGPKLSYWDGKDPELKTDASDNPAEVLLRYERLGFMLVGYSSLAQTGLAPDPDDAIAAGRNEGADLVVLLAPKSLGMVSLYEPLQGYSSLTSWTGVSATAQSRGVQTSLIGSSASTSVGTTTTYVPVARERSAYVAMYFLKPRLALGLFLRELTDQERQLLASNHGAVVRSVVNDSPSFAADLLPGDILLTINEKPLSTAEGVMDFQFAKVGWPADYRVVLLRNSERIEKTLKVTP